MPTRATLLIALGLTVTVISGCATIRWALMAFAPPEKVQPQYTLEPGQTVLVFPDDWHEPLSYPPLKRMLAEQLNFRLTRQDLAAATVPYTELLDLQSRENDFATTAIATVGSRLGANLVVYIDVRQFHLKENLDGPLWQGRMSAYVKVLDVARSKRVWPEDGTPEGYLVEVELPLTESDDKAYGQRLAAELAATMADRIAKLFYVSLSDPLAPPVREGT